MKQVKCLNSSQISSLEKTESGNVRFPLHYHHGRKFWTTSNSQLLFKLKPTGTKVHHLEISSHMWKDESKFFLSFYSD